MNNQLYRHQIGSIPPSIWGNAGWRLLFSIAYVYPKNNPDIQVKQDYFLFFTHLKNMLPCEKCRQHYSQYLENKPFHFYLHNRESIFHWLLGLHNKSNPNTMLHNSQQAVTRYLKIEPKALPECLGC